MVHTSNDDTTSNPAAATAAATGMSPSHVSSNSNSNANSTASNNNAKIANNPNRSPRIRPGNMNMNMANMNMNMNMNRNHLNHLNNTVPISGPTPNYSAMGALQQHQLNMNSMNMNMNMYNNLSAGGQVPTRFHLTPNSVPPSPPFHPSIHTSHIHGTPFVPNLNIAPPGSPLHANINDYDYGDDRTDPAFGSSSPYMRATKSAVDTALANERDRIKSLELQEQESFASGNTTGTVSIEQYKMALKRERQYSRRLVGELAALKSVAVTSTLEAEINEEGRINCLMRRLDILQKEKGRIIVELEREEEMVRFVLSYFVVLFVICFVLIYS